MRISLEDLSGILGMEETRILEFCAKYRYELYIYNTAINNKEEILAFMEISNALLFLHQLFKQGFFRKNPDGLSETEYKLRHFKKRYDIRYTVLDNLFTNREYNGIRMISSYDLCAAAQIYESVSRWVSRKSKALNLEKGKDYVLTVHGYRDRKTEYLFTFDAALKMLKGVKYATPVKENLLAILLKSPHVQMDNTTSSLKKGKK